MGLRAELHLFNGVGLVKKVTHEQRLERGEKVSLAVIGGSVSVESSHGP